MQKDEMMFDLITTRHSCRKFMDKDISLDDVQKILDCGLAAPSAMNKQPWFFVVIKNKNVMDKLKNLAKKSFQNCDDEWRRNWANQEGFSPFYDPNIMILICNKKDVPNSKKDCCFAVQNMTLMAESLGLGSCIIQDICWAIDENNKSEFQIPSDYEIYLALSVGYPKIPNNTKKPADLSKYIILGN